MKKWEIEVSAIRCNIIKLEAPTKEAAMEAAGLSYTKEEVDKWDDTNNAWQIDHIEETEE